MKQSHKSHKKKATHAEDEEEEEDFTVRPPNSANVAQSGGDIDDDDDFDAGETLDEKDMVYEDDGEGDDEEEDDEPDVQLGVVTGKRFNFLTMPTTPCTTKLFGSPDLIDPSAFDEFPSCCGRPLLHLCQVSLPFEEWEERTIYVFGCWKCDDSYRAFRQQRRKPRGGASAREQGVKPPASSASSPSRHDDDGGKSERPPATTSTLGSWDLGGDQGDGNEINLGELVKATRRIEMNDTSNPSSSSSGGGQKSATSLEESESEKKRREDARTTILLEMVAESPASSGSSGASAAFLGAGFEHERRLLEKYNKAAKAMGEDTFEFSVPTRVRAEDHDYVSRVALNPKQRIRVCYGGKPLLPDGVGAAPPPPPCEKCGAVRKFEFQIVSTFIPDAEKALARTFDWSTLLVYACDASCASPQTEEEYCRVVWED